jgi:quinol monooxygenase YgiN
MIVLKAQLTIKPETRPEFLQHMQALIQASLGEAGCLSFGCYEDVTTSNSFLILEEWHSRAALDQHEQAEHLALFKTNIKGMLVSRRDTQVYTVSEVSGLHR